MGLASRSRPWRAGESIGSLSSAGVPVPSATRLVLGVARTVWPPRTLPPRACAWWSAPSVWSSPHLAVSVASRCSCVPSGRAPRRRRPRTSIARAAPMRSRLRVHPCAQPGREVLPARVSRLLVDVTRRLPGAGARAGACTVDGRGAPAVGASVLAPAAGALAYPVAHPSERCSSYRRVWFLGWFFLNRVLLLPFSLRAPPREPPPRSGIPASPPHSLSAGTRPCGGHLFISAFSRV